jgi:hypothetical protein
VQRQRRVTEPSWGEPDASADTDDPAALIEDHGPEVGAALLEQPAGRRRTDAHVAAQQAGQQHPRGLRAVEQGVEVGPQEQLGTAPGATTGCQRPVPVRSRPHRAPVTVVLAASSEPTVERGDEPCGAAPAIGLPAIDRCSAVTGRGGYPAHGPSGR